MLNLSTNAKQITSQISADVSKVRRATQRALNTAANGGRTDATREITARYTAPANKIRGAFSVQGATLYVLASTLKARGRAMPLYDFKVTPKQPLSSYRRRRTIAGVTVEVRRGNPQLIPHSFVARMKNGHLGVMTRYRRSGGKSRRLPIRQMTGSDVPGMFGADLVQAATRAKVGDRFEHELTRQVALIARGF